MLENMVNSNLINHYDFFPQFLAERLFTSRGT
jgi:hypothetical protein